MKISKFKLVLRLDKLTKSSNKAPIRLRITKDRRAFYRTITHLEPAYWDAKNECVKKQHPNVVELNALISKRVAEIKKEISLVEIVDDEASISVIRNKLDNRTSFDVFEYADKEMELMFKRGQHATYKKYKSVITKLKAFVGKDVLRIKNITLEFVKQYENHLLNEIKNNRNTTTVNLKALARLVNDIYRNYDLESNKNPFKKFKMKRELTERVYLEANEVKRIEKLRLRTANRAYDAKDVFLVECYTGLRISDILNLRWKNYNGNELAVRMRKTDKDHVIKVNKVVKGIIDKRRGILEVNNENLSPDRYIFNILTVDINKISPQDALNAISGATALINKNLKKVAEKAEIQKNISTHLARHKRKSYRLLINKLRMCYFSIGNDLETNLVLRYA